jgi:DNA-binding IscR family transcriptional regulator
MLNVLEDDGLILPSSDDNPRYLPARSLNRISLIDILRSSRMAEEDNQRSSLYCDPAVAGLMRDIESEYENQLGEQSLADFLSANPEPETS